MKVANLVMSGVWLLLSAVAVAKTCGIADGNMRVGVCVAVADGDAEGSGVGDGNFGGEHAATNTATTIRIICHLLFLI